MEATPKIAAPAPNIIADNRIARSGH